MNAAFWLVELLVAKSEGLLAAALQSSFNELTFFILDIFDQLVGFY